jgi:hypothetical protein
MSEWVSGWRIFRPEGAFYESPGQRPGNPTTRYIQALKGRPKVAKGSALWAAPLGLGCWDTGESRALPWATLGCAFGANIFRPEGAFHDSPGQRPGTDATHHSPALKGRPKVAQGSAPGPRPPKIHQP